MPPHILKVLTLQLRVVDAEVGQALVTGPRSSLRRALKE
jgi:hypothetical protein